MIDITPRSSPGDVIGGGVGGGGGSSSGYHRETATESDTEREFGHSPRTMHQHHHHQHVPTHSAFGDPMDGEFRSQRERKSKREIEIPLRKASVCGVNQDHDHMRAAMSPQPSFFARRGTQLYLLRVGNSIQLISTIISSQIYVHNCGDRGNQFAVWTKIGKHTSQ